MIIWDVKIGAKTVLRFKSEATAKTVADAINSGEMYEEPATVADTRAPRKAAPKATAKVRRGKI